MSLLKLAAVEKMLPMGASPCSAAFRALAHPSASHRAGWQSQSGANCFSTGPKPAHPPFSFCNAPLAISGLKDTGAGNWAEVKQPKSQESQCWPSGWMWHLGMWFSGQHRVLVVVVGVGLAVLCWWLDSMILGVFPNLNEYMILWFLFQLAKHSFSLAFKCHT